MKTETGATFPPLYFPLVKTPGSRNAATPAASASRVSPGKRQALLSLRGRADRIPAGASHRGAHKDSSGPPGPAPCRNTGHVRPGERPRACGGSKPILTSTHAATGALPLVLPRGHPQPWEHRRPSPHVSRSLQRSCVPALGRSRTSRSLRLLASAPAAHGGRFSSHVKCAACEQADQRTPPPAASLCGRYLHAKGKRLDGSASLAPRGIRGYPGKRRKQREEARQKRAKRGPGGFRRKKKGICSVFHGAGQINVKIKSFLAGNAGN